jgi:signal transduction histidine kinase
MQRLIRESLGSLKEMVSFTTPQISRPISLVERLREIAEIHCGDTPHDFSAAPGLEGISVSSAHRRCLRLFLKEAVNNAVRHSGAGRIDFQIRREEDGRIWLSVCDDGKGLPADVIGKSEALPTLRLRAQEMDARFRVSNPPGGGCEVAVTIRAV